MPVREKQTATMIILATICTFAGALPMVAADEQNSQKLPQGRYLYLGLQPGDTQAKSFTVDAQGTIRWQDYLNQTTGQSPQTPAGQSQLMPKQQENHQGFLFGGWTKPKPKKPVPIVQPSGVITFPAANGQVASMQPPISYAQGPPQQRLDQVQNADVRWEQRAYPLIKWKPTQFAPVPGAISQLTTTLVKTQSPYSSVYRPIYTCTIKYKLTLFKVLSPPYMVEVQFLDANGFNLEKISLPGSEFHPVPGGDSLFEANGESSWQTEDDYRSAVDYSVH